MVRITEEMLRRKSEHNEKEITTLEELSLHQEDIEKIEHLQNWCKDLQILLLQSNLISKIENLGKLKKLQYLNLALNNIEIIENLEKLESLQKLDLTLNFIGKLSSVCNLENNYNFQELVLTGNPCTDYQGYREYVIMKLPQLKKLDCVDIERSERILANQRIDEFDISIRRDEDRYKRKREAEKGAEVVEIEDDDESGPDMTPEELDAFWSSPSSNTPEDRIKIANHSRRMRRKGQSSDKKNKKEEPRRLFTSDGRPLNINQARIPLLLSDDDDTGCKVVDVAVYKFLDTSYIDVDLHPRYVTITIKGKLLQLVFEEDICVDKSTCQRSQTTGHLVLRLPKEGFQVKAKPRKVMEEKMIPPPTGLVSKREYLEIGPASNDMDFSKITETYKPKSIPKTQPLKPKIQEKMPPPDFVDDEDVPPLE